MHDREVIEFVSRMLWPDGEGAFEENARAIGCLDRQNRLIAGGVYHNWNPANGTIELSFAATTPRWATQSAVSGFLAYPFLDCGCQMIVSVVSENNYRVRKLLSGVGFKHHIISRLYGKDEAGVIYTLTDDDWQSGRYF